VKKYVWSRERCERGWSDFSLPVRKVPRPQYWSKNINTMNDIDLEKLIITVLINS
jgi:hypothetical protein